MLNQQILAKKFLKKANIEENITSITTVKSPKISPYNESPTRLRELSGSVADDDLTKSNEESVNYSLPEVISLSDDADEVSISKMTSQSARDTDKSSVHLKLILRGSVLLINTQEKKLLQETETVLRMMTSTLKDQAEDSFPGSELEEGDDLFEEEGRSTANKIK